MVDSVINHSTPGNTAEPIVGDVDDEVVSASGFVSYCKTPNGYMINAR